MSCFGRHPLHSRGPQVLGSQLGHSVSRPSGHWDGWCFPGAGIRHSRSSASLTRNLAPQVSQIRISPAIRQPSFSGRLPE